ncbi:MAG: ABC transporter ATP-binding protein [Acholeplasmatales bacterium]|nr:ABC transporter ATP-binding protein [Acholeplasmatales bacterium]
MNIIEIKNLVIKFNARGKNLTAIRNLSLDIKKGEILTIVGESGSGKSVMTKALTGMLDDNGWIDSGSISYDGIDLSKLKTDKNWQGIRGKKIATIFQDPMTSLNPLRRIGSQITETILAHKDISKEEAKKEALDILNRVGIKDALKRYNDYPFQYSGGMRQRVVIAIALSCSPEILICDEPTTALDVTIQAQIIDLIKELKEQYNFTVIFITHDLGVVASIADRVAVMYAGQIVELGSVDEIFYDPYHPYTWSLLSSMPQLVKENEELYSIPGTPPSLFTEIKGDAFAPRNPYALEIDFIKEPPMFKITETHYAKTWLLDSRAPKIERPKALENIKTILEKEYGSNE